MGTMATNAWWERDGKRTTMTNGRDGIADCIEKSPATQLTAPEDINWRGKIQGMGSRFTVCAGSVGGKWAVNRDKGKAVNVNLIGEGKGNALSVLSDMQTGEKWKDGSVTRDDPAIRRLVTSDCLIDVRGKGAYPIIFGEKCVAGTLGVRRYVGKSDGPGGGGKTMVRCETAANRFINEDGEALDGMAEYMTYWDWGGALFDPFTGKMVDPSAVVRNLKGANFGRGIAQEVKRFSNVSPLPGHETGVSLIENIWCDQLRDNAIISITGAGHRIDLRNIGGASDYNSALLSLRHDVKQTQYSGTGSGGSGGSFTCLGPGLMQPAPEGSEEWERHSHSLLIVDLRGSKFRSGRKIPGQTFKSQREALMMDSCEDVLVISDGETVVQAGAEKQADGSYKSMANAVHFESNGAGQVRTNKGVPIGTRRIDNIDVSADSDFSGWDGKWLRAGVVVHPDQYRTLR